MPNNGRVLEGSLTGCVLLPSSAYSCLLLRLTSTATKPRIRRSESVDTAYPATDEIFQTLFSVLCCVMIADGRASRSEKTRIRELMCKAKAPWSRDSMDDRLSEFIRQVQTRGYNAVVSDTLSRVPLFKQLGRQDVLLKCVDSIAAADSKLDPKEKAFCDRIRETVA